MMSIALASHGTTAAHGFMHASLSSSMQDVRVRVRQLEPPLVRWLRRVVDLDDAGDGLLLEPLPRVPLARCRRAPPAPRPSSVPRRPAPRRGRGEHPARRWRAPSSPGTPRRAARELLDLFLVRLRQLDCRHGRPPSHRVVPACLAPNPDASYCAATCVASTNAGARDLRLRGDVLRFEIAQPTSTVRSASCGRPKASS